MIHHYIKYGYDFDRLAALSPWEKEFLRANMELDFEEEKEKYNALLGGG